MVTLIKLNEIENKCVYFDNFEKRIIKLYLFNNKEAKLKTKNEYLGYSWYLKQLEKKNVYNYFNKNIILDSEKLNFSVIKGSKIKFWNNEIDNIQLSVNSVINHYLKIWPQKVNLCPYHGDLTLDNILFLNRSDKPFFIDWENYINKEVWGLDLCYFLISIIVLPALSKKKDIDINQIKVVKKIWDKIFKKKNFSYLKNPISYINKINSKKNNFFTKITPKMREQIYNFIL